MTAHRMAPMRSRLVLSLVVGAVALASSAAATAAAPLAPPATPGVPVAADQASGMPSPSASGNDASVNTTLSGAERTVAYGGIELTVPVEWPVVDLAQHPTRCMRVDQPVVYLGERSPDQDQDCPARLVGRADTVWIGEHATQVDPSARAGDETTFQNGRSGGTLRKFAEEQAQTLVLQGTSKGVRTTSSPKGDAPIKRVLDSVKVSSAPAAPESPSAEVPAAEPSAPSSPSGSAEVSPSSLRDSGSTAAPIPARTLTGASPTVPTSTTAAAAFGGGNLYGGMAFDTCAPPSLNTMQAWRQSPYAAIGIYTSGSMRACPYGLTAAWMSGVAAQGWGIIPIHVGLQAPCVGQAGLATLSRDIPTARAQGVSEAQVAIAGAKALGLGPGTTIYNDLESYAANDPGCSAATVALVATWTQELRRQGYLSGVYGSVGGLMRDMVGRIVAGDASFTPPDKVWMAHWNQLQTTRDTYSPQYLPDIYWANHQRMRQYSGGANHTWGGVTLNIDQNWADLPLDGNPVQTNYGAATVGPGSPGFVFTGSMSYWKPEPGRGAQGKAYTTGPSTSTTEHNGATWAPTLGPGGYRVEANVPDPSVATRARYTLASAAGVSTVSLDQSAGTAGYRALGNVIVEAGRPATVHLGDNGQGVATRRIWADAVRFVQISSLPAAPGNVAASAGDGSAVIRWDAAASNGSSITGYTVRVSPGGQVVSVGTGATSAVVMGLINGTAYTFTVTATNAIGEGPASLATAPVIPAAGGGVRTIDPLRIMDTRSGASLNPGLVSAIPPSGSVRVRVAGGKSPAPAGVASVLANLTVVAGNSPGVMGVAGAGSSLINWTPGAIVANLVSLPVAADGTVTLANHSASASHVIVDLQGWTSPQETPKISAIAPDRLLDTRSGTQGNGRATALAPGESIVVQVTGGAVPAGAEAAVFRVTATQPGAAGFLSVSPSGAASTSVVNFTPGMTVGNSVVANLSSTGSVRVTNGSSMPTHVVVDVQGWVGASGAEFWRATAPGRLADTRVGTTANPSVGALGPGEVRTFRVAGLAGSPIPAGVSIAALNVTVTNGTGSGWVAVGTANAPGIPVLNYVPGEARAGFGLTAVAADGTVRVRNGSGGSVHVVLDVVGYGTTTR